MGEGEKLLLAAPPETNFTPPGRATPEAMLVGGSWWFSSLSLLLDDCVS